MRNPKLLEVAEHECWNGLPPAHAQRDKANVEHRVERCRMNHTWILLGVWHILRIIPQRKSTRRTPVAGVLDIPQALEIWPVVEARLLAQVFVQLPALYTQRALLCRGCVLLAHGACPPSFACDCLGRGLRILKFNTNAAKRTLNPLVASERKHPPVVYALSSVFGCMSARLKIDFRLSALFRLVHRNRAHEPYVFELVPTDCRVGWEKLPCSLNGHYEHACARVERRAF